MPHAYLNINLHIVFSTKNHEPLISRDRADELWSFLGSVAKNLGAVPLSVNGARDHAHLLVSMPANLTVADLVRRVKGTSSRWFSQRFDVHFAWQTGYSVFSVSRSNLERVRAYIDRQPERHKRISFREEWAALLRRHGIDFDERYVGKGGLEPPK